MSDTETAARRPYHRRTHEVDAEAASAPAEERPDRGPRPSRKPFGSMEQRLSYPPRPGYRRYWFNDIPGRIDRAREAGYTHVVDGDGKNVKRVVGKSDAGGGQIGYLMEIPQEWYEEDMAAAQAERDKTMSAIKRGEHGPGRDDNRYVPATGIKIEHRR